MTTRNSAYYRLTDRPGIRMVGDEELQRVFGGKSIWGHIKDAAKWVGNHVVVGLHYIGIKGSF